MNFWTNDQVFLRMNPNLTDSLPTKISMLDIKLVKFNPKWVKLRTIYYKKKKNPIYKKIFKSIYIFGKAYSYNKKNLKISNLNA